MDQIRTVKQPEGSKSCGAAVAAMVTGKELDEVLNGRDELCLSRTSDLARYFLDNGWFMGTGLVPAKPKLRGLDLNIEMTLDKKLAVLSVPSETRPEWGHWVLWDGIAGFVRDPNPKVGDFRFITSLNVQEIWFLQKFEA